MKNLTIIPICARALVLLAVCLGGTFPTGAALVAAWGDNTYGQCVLPNGLNDIKAVAAGQYHNIALRTDGTVVAWGENTFGQTNVPAAISRVTAISAGAFHNLALKADGTVVAWGRSPEGQTNVPVGLSNVVAVAAGGGQSLALKADGTLVAWGNNYFGLTDVPAGLSDVIQISAGGLHNLALKMDGTLVAWGGANSYGEINIPDGMSNVVAIAAGGNHNVALKSDGTVVAWGYAEQGQTNVPAGLSNVVKIAAGTYQSLAIKADGSVVAWGLNDWSVGSLPAGMSNVIALDGGYTHAVALVFDGPVQLLQQPVSQGIPYTSNVTFSVVASGYELLSYQWLFNGTPMGQNNARVSGATNASMTISNLQFSDIGTYTVVVSNAFGSVISSAATLTVISPPFFTSQSATNQTVRAGTNLTLSAVASGTPALAYQWLLNGTNLPGRTSTVLSLLNLQPNTSGIYSLLVTNNYGAAQANFSLTVTDSAPYIVRQPFVQQSDQTSTTNPVVPVGGSITVNVGVLGSTPLTFQWRFQGADIPGATNATLSLSNMVAGQTGFYSLEVQNAFGSVISAKLFVNVVQVFVWDAKRNAMTNTPLGLTNVVSVAAGYSHVLALKSDGRVVAWGGSLFFPPAVITNVPSSVTNVAAIAAAGNCCMALRSNGTVVVWGNTAAQTNTPAGATNIMAIAAGEIHCLALRSNGTVLAWGSQSGVTTIPVGLSNVVAIAAGPVHNLALKSDGRVVAWGNSYGVTTNIVAGLSNVITIDVAGTSSVALREDGRAFSWINTSSPLAVNVTNLVAVAAGPTVNLAIKADGGIAQWFNGQVQTAPALTNVIAIANGEQNGFSVAVIGDGSPFFTVQPVSQLVARSNTVRLQARTAGLIPTRYQWQFNGVNLLNATNTSLTISNIQGKDLGSYRCVATNVRGTSTSNPALLSFPPYTGTLPQALNATNQTWIFESQSQWFAQNRETHGDEAAGQSGVTTNGGQSILQTTITGPGKLTFWWKVSSEEGYDFLGFYDNASTPTFRISGETEWLQVTQAISSGAHILRWIYSKDVSVSAGRDAGWLDEVTFVPDPPTFLLQPVSRTVTRGQTVAFTGSASAGGQQVGYQWQKNGTNVDGSQLQLTLSNVSRADAGNYTLRATSVGGTTVSTNAVLRVRVPQQLSAPELSPDGSVSVLSRAEDGFAMNDADLAGFDAQASENLVDWITLPNSLSVTNGALLLRDPDGTIHPQLFYRIVER